MNSSKISDNEGGATIELSKLEDAAQRLRLHNPKHHAPPPNPTTVHGRTSRAAVLVCIFQGDGGDLRVILTKRASNLNSHPGEVAFPGGKREDGDADDVATATREAREEIGLDPSLLDVVAVLDPFVQKRGMTVVPVVAILHNKKAYHPIPSAAEVEAIFDVPLEMFLKDEGRRAEEREWMGDKYLLHFFDYEADDKKYVVWALTAGILIQTASIVYQKVPEFEELRPKFWSRVAENGVAMS